MSPELLGVIIGGLIGLISSLVGIFINHWLSLNRDKNILKLEAERELRKKLTEGMPVGIYNQGIEKIYAMIDEGKLPRAYAFDPTVIDSIFEELIKEK